MATRRGALTSFWQRLRRGPWPEAVLARLRQALTALADAVAEAPGDGALVLFGSYARGDYGRKSDVDLLLLLADSGHREQLLRRAGELESEFRLPMHLALLIADPGCPAELGADLLRAIWTDGVILFGEAASLARLQPEGMAPWEIVRFTGKRLTPAQRVELSRRLYGRGERSGLVARPGLALGSGVLLLPPAQVQSVHDALDEFGATYDAFPVWRFE